MVVANVDPLPRFSLGCSVVSASSIRIIRNYESLTNVSRTVKSLSRLIVSNARLMSIGVYPVREKIFENVAFSPLANGNQIARLPCSGRVEIHSVLGRDIRRLYLQFVTAQLMRVSCVMY